MSGTSAGGQIHTQPFIAPIVTLGPTTPKPDKSQASYVLVDDVATLGATFAALHNHIVGAGGTVCAVSALAHRDGLSQKLQISPQQVDEIQALYGPDVLSCWKEVIGH